MLGQDSVVGPTGDSGTCSGRTSMAGRNKEPTVAHTLIPLLAWQYAEPMFGLAGGHWAVLTQGTHCGLLGGMEEAVDLMLWLLWQMFLECGS